MFPPKDINKLDDFKQQVWEVIFKGLKKDSLKRHEKAVVKEKFIKKTSQRS